ncbi:hypothetical protein LP422_17975 [Janibacter limosus]|uniref:Uncharacterized protein n=1 Tax=Janibacter limosus TaxID=53458 RepID=A0AC61U2U9_9MICO|nr:hypothetical protein [Janibacter limosus]UUZ44329.1 hypothetical protein LP422_17975 [Janibacter limosus]
MPSSRKSPVVPVLVAVAAAPVPAVVLVQGRGDAPNADAAPSVSRSEATASSQTREKIVRREAGDPMALGEADAPVVMIAYS